MNIVQESFKRLYPDKELSRDCILEYSGKFSDFNGNIRVSPFKIIISMSKKWKNVDPEIRIGLIQELMCKVFKTRKLRTMNIDLYHNFIKNLHLSVAKTESDPLLLESFNGMNELFFMHGIELPNLKWGSKNFRVLGTYEYQTDTITISSALRNADHKLLDYVMYHEMLHKKFKYSHNNGKSYHHTSEFRSWERKYPDWQEMENKLKKLSRWTLC